MLRADIEYRHKGLFGNDYDSIVTGPNGTKTFYGKESHDEAWNYYQSEKRLEDEITLRQKQSDLADMQMREIQERERHTQEERFRTKNTPPQFGFGGMSPQRMLTQPTYYDPEYIEFQKWKKENDPEYRRFKIEKTRKTLEANRLRQEEDAQIKKETISEAKKLLANAKKQVHNKNLLNAQEKIKEIEFLIQKGTYTDLLNAIDMLKMQSDWQLNKKETFKACLSNFDSDKNVFEMKRIQSISKAKTELFITKQSITSDKNGQTKNIILNIEKLIRKKTYNDSEEAIRLLTQKYTWETETKKKFTASLIDFESQLAKTKALEAKTLEKRILNCVKDISYFEGMKVAKTASNSKLLTALFKNTLCYHSSPTLLDQILANPNTPTSIFMDIAKSSNIQTKIKLAEFNKTPQDVLDLLAKTYDLEVKCKVAKNPNATVDILRFLAQGNPKIELIFVLLSNPNCPLDVKLQLEKLKSESFKKPQKNNNGSCFVATACYGDYNSPEVLVLRAYRDEKLLKTRLGSFLVKLYYFISPPLANQIKKSEKAKKYIRSYFLKPIIEKINKTNNSVNLHPTRGKKYWG